MCGEFAADARAVPLLLGMGLDEFSMASRPRVRRCAIRCEGLPQSRLRSLREGLWRQERKKRSEGYWNAEIEMLK